MWAVAPHSTAIDGDAAASATGVNEDGLERKAFPGAGVYVGELDGEGRQARPPALQNAPPDLQI